MNGHTWEIRATGRNRKGVMLRTATAIDLRDEQGDLDPCNCFGFFTSFDEAMQFCEEYDASHTQPEEE
jgi:hypothetical protein